MNIWILIWRLNPPHLWHMKILDYSLKNDDKTILFLWSSNKQDKNNPFNYKKRKALIKKLYNNSFIIIKPLEDKKEDLDWIKSINNKLLNLGVKNKDNIIFYWWDFKNDYAIKVIKQYEKKFIFWGISYKEISRNKYFINYKTNKLLLSSTLVRQAIKNNDYDLIKKLVSQKIYKELWLIK